MLPGPSLDAASSESLVQGPNAEKGPMLDGINPSSICIAETPDLTVEQTRSTTKRSEEVVDGRERHERLASIRLPPKPRNDSRPARQPWLRNRRNSSEARQSGTLTRARGADNSDSMQCLCVPDHVPGKPTSHNPVLCSYWRSPPTNGLETVHELAVSSCVLYLCTGTGVCPQFRYVPPPHRPGSGFLRGNSAGRVAPPRRSMNRPVQNLILMGEWRGSGTCKAGVWWAGQGHDSLKEVIYAYTTVTDLLESPFSAAGRFGSCEYQTAIAKSSEMNCM
ncbi:hypothetical protein QBC40DRAFT_292526 [Triangularia verruculosa]|uniref:Uncharacterized protein n=1 Tax=Triangularia verruculosa TaxID=2587418 RepID=A0AAN6XPQ2_9PEZI|nr:hypothetical protein QBC40DRAFT_292526 [Triangularia verruculosa]